MILFMLRIVGRVFSGSYRDSAFIVVKDGFLAIELMLGWCLTLIICFSRMICTSHHLLILMIHLRSILLILVIHLRSILMCCG